MGIFESLSSEKVSADLSILFPHINKSLDANLWFEGSLKKSEDFFCLARMFGKIIAPRFSDPIIQHLSPKPTSQATNPSPSAKYGMNSFPIHTDCAHHVNPPKYVLLYSPDVDETDTETKIVIPDLPRLMKLDVFRSPRVFSNGRKYFLSPIISHEYSKSQIRFDVGCMSKDSRISIDCPTIFSELSKNSVELSTRWSKGRLLIFDNHQCLHGRDPVKKDGKRNLYRALIA